MFQLYRGSQFHWWRKPEYSENTTHLSQVTDELYHIMLYRVHLVTIRIRNRNYLRFATTWVHPRFCFCCFIVFFALFLFLLFYFFCSSFFVFNVVFFIFIITTKCICFRFVSCSRAMLPVFVCTRLTWCLFVTEDIDMISDIWPPNVNWSSVS